MALSSTKVTPDIIEKFNAGKILLKANPTLLDETIGKLSPAAQEPAKKYRDMILKDDVDLEKFMSGGNAIKAGCSSAVQKELEGFKFDFGDILSLW
ncbi:hypothetical protein PENTCL1PPCAC_23731 [Pristionchus entomophagus]|uniref:Transaldolase n=1 Tax=Pristionchus entomophagus TaxID=358040 RepID=A0AAV5U596_9BILA|nr:hypothetical protein PENTCL1PPCAC_23731 [Pristionchus entomophagus]